MAQLTVEQRDALTQLKVEYGEPEVVAIEFTRQAYGVLKVEWAENKVARVPRRQLFVRPDGSRLSWRTIEYDGVAVLL